MGGRCVCRYAPYIVYRCFTVSFSDVVNSLSLSRHIRRVIYMWLSAFAGDLILSSWVFRRSGRPILSSRHWTGWKSCHLSTVIWNLFQRLKIRFDDFALDVNVEYRLIVNGRSLRDRIYRHIAHAVTFLINNYKSLLIRSKVVNIAQLFLEWLPSKL